MEELTERWEIVEKVMKWGEGTQTQKTNKIKRNKMTNNKTKLSHKIS